MSENNNKTENENILLEINEEEPLENKKIENENNLFLTDNNLLEINDEEALILTENKINSILNNVSPVLFDKPIHNLKNISPNVSPSISPNN